MRRVPFLICCWPGLARLWLRGDWFALTLALGFALLLNFALLSTFVWHDVLGSHFVWVAWPLLVTSWVVSFYRTPRVMAGLGMENAPDKKSTQCLSEAHVEYLKGNWIDAEALLNRLIDMNRGDLEAWIMKIGLLRRTNRLAEARQHLQKVTQFENAARWSYELAQEGRRIDDMERDLLGVVDQDDSGLRIAEGTFEVNDLRSEAA